MHPISKTLLSAALSSALNGAATAVLSHGHDTLRNAALAALAGAVIGVANLFTQPPGAKP